MTEPAATFWRGRSRRTGGRSRSLLLASLAAPTSRNDRSTKGVGRRERKWSREAWRHLPEGVPPPDELLRRRWQWALRITSLARADEGAGARPDDGELHPPRQCARGQERQDP